MMSDCNLNPRILVEEPVLDTASRYYVDPPSSSEIEGHRSALYVGFHLPVLNNSQRRRRHAQKKKKTRENETHGGGEETAENVFFGLPDDSELEPAHQMFCEMDEFLLTHDEESGKHIGEWTEAARWIKFEEDVEKGGERWSKPHVATLPLYSLFEVRSCFSKGLVMLNIEATSMEQVTEAMLNRLVADGHLKYEFRDKVRDIMLRKHSHLYSRKSMKMRAPGQLPIIRSFADMGRKHSSKDLQSDRRYSAFTTNECSRGLESHLDPTDPLLPKSKSVHLIDNADTNLEEHDENASTLISRNASTHKFDVNFMKKIPTGSETSNILVGEADFLEHQIVCLIRLKDALLLHEVTEVPVPTRFIFVLLGPIGNAQKYHQIGRSVATLMSDEIFRDVAYSAKSKSDLLAGIDEFLSNCTILPPGEWDPTIRIEPPKSVPSQEARKVVSPASMSSMNASNVVNVPVSGKDDKGDSRDNGNLRPNQNVQPLCVTLASAEDEKPEGDHDDPALQKSGRLFGGLINDIKRRWPHYFSDFKDAIHIQCFASFFFLYFACLTPIITFGGLLEQATGGYLGTMESIVSGAVVGVTYALFSGQPLTILGSTGPVLVFEKIVYSMTKSLEWEYLSFRMSIGLWVMLILLLFVMFDLSYLVKYITRFTEESFAFLIALIFIIEAFKKQMHILDEYPVNRNWSPGIAQSFNCSCYPINDSATLNVTSSEFIFKSKLWKPPLLTNDNNRTNQTTVVGVDFATVSRGYFSWDWVRMYKICNEFDGFWLGTDCGSVYFPDVFFFSCLIFIFTFVISYGLKMIRSSRFFPTMVRSLISDFAVMIAIICMTGCDLLLGLETPKLNVPQKVAPTLGYEIRGWIINPIGRNPWWTTLAALGPALLAVILIFMDQQITAVIVNRKENKMKKGAGYHLDLLILAILIGVNSAMGIPWFVAATVLSINHVMSLKKTSGKAAPGESPQFLGCREQRVTGTLIFLTVGLSVFLTPILKHIPMAVLYGVFLFMGVSSLRGVQLVQRIFLLLMPQKYQPDYIYLRHVPILRVHIFTVIQVLCLVLLFTIKSIKVISIAFPLMVLAMCFIRKGLEWIFSSHELKWLDDLMPEFKKRQQEDAKSIEMDEVQVPLQDGQTVSISVNQISITPAGDADINLSDQMVKTAIWRQLSQEDKRRRRISGNLGNHPTDEDKSEGRKSRKISRGKSGGASSGDNADFSNA